MMLVHVGQVKNSNSVMENCNPLILRVVAAIILHPVTGHILIAKRQSFQHEGGKWEFPGGKVNANETLFDALVRECYEELGCIVLDASLYERSEQASLHIEFWKVATYQNVPFGREGQEIRWVPVENLKNYVFPGANQRIIEKISAG